MKLMFTCPDQKKVLISECLKECRIKHRCAPVSYLRMSGQSREWNGICSVTQLLRGIRESYLMIKNDYAESPESNTFAIAGTKSHSALEKYGIDPEKGIVYEGISGIPDEIDGKTLIDYKFSGSYKVAQVLGIKMQEKETGEYFKNGNPKVKKVPVYGEKDFGDWGKQVNMYRIMLQSIGVEIDEQKLFMVPRDGGTYMATSRGVTDSMYYLDVPFIGDFELKTWFFSRRDQLLDAVNNDIMPPLCSEEESWQGKKCQKYCSVKEFCTGNPYLIGE